MTWLSGGLRKLYVVGLDYFQRVEKFYSTGFFTGQLIIAITGLKNGAINIRGYGLKEQNIDVNRLQMVVSEKDFYDTRKSFNI